MPISFNMYSVAAASLKHKTHFRFEVARRPPLEILSYPLISQFTCEWEGEISSYFQNEHVKLSEYTQGDPRSSLGGFLEELSLSAGQLYSLRKLTISEPV